MKTKKDCVYIDKCDMDRDCEDCTAEQKIDNLKKAIEDIGYKIEETKEGEIKISEK